MNRLNRDQLIIRALDLVDNPSLDQHDRPAGTVAASAWMIGWLQDGLDYIHHLYPWGGAVKSASVTITGGVQTASLPGDFILDYKNGLTFPTGARARRRSLNQLLNGNLDERGTPRIYTLTTPNLSLWPIPDKNYTAKLWYYSLPAVLNSGDIPNFPSDWVLIKYLEAQRKEWAGALAAGTSMLVLETYASKLQKAGIGNELEDEQLGDFSETVPGPVVSDPTDWMGRSSL